MTKSILDKDLRKSSFNNKIGPTYPINLKPNNRSASKAL